MGAGDGVVVVGPDLLASADFGGKIFQEAASDDTGGPANASVGSVGAMAVEGYVV